MTVDSRPLCSRVVINHHGGATTPERAFNEHGIIARVIFVRRDGWKLGAPPELENVARKLWEDEWVGVMRWPDWEQEPFSTDD